MSSTSHDNNCEVIVEKFEKVLMVKFNRPAVKNALNYAAYLRIIAALEVATSDEQITTVVFTGSGNYFCSGNDLNELSQFTSEKRTYNEGVKTFEKFVRGFINCPKILVALVNGPAIGLGVALAALCDVVYCCQQTYFYTPFVTLGFCPEACASHTLPLLMGLSKAMELAVLDEKLSARGALECGFVARVFPNAKKMLQELWPKLRMRAQLPVESLLTTKRLIRNDHREQLLKALQRELKALEALTFPGGEGGTEFQRRSKL